MINTLKPAETYTHTHTHTDSFCQAKFCDHHAGGNGMIKKSIFFIFVILFSTQNVFAICRCPVESNCNAWCDAHCATDGKGNHWDCSSDLEPLGGDSYTIYYQCPSGGTTPASTTTNPFTGRYTLKTVSSACTKTGYTGSDWACYKYGTNTSAPLSLSGTYPYTYDVTCKSTSWVANKYTLKYTCGDGTGNDETNNMTYDTTNYSLKTDSGNCSKTNATFDGWSCKNSYGSEVTLSTSTTKWNIASNVTCTAQWREIPKINLEFYEDADATTLVTTGQCIVDGIIGTLPKAPRKPGYKFTGWKLRDKGIAIIEEFGFEKASNIGYGYNWTGECYKYDYSGKGTRYTCSETPDLGGKGEWKAEIEDFGTIYGEASCNSTSGTFAVTTSTSHTKNTSTPSGNQKYCWCRVTGVTKKEDTRQEVGGTYKVSSSAWVYQGNGSNPGTCSANCANACSDQLRGSDVYRKKILEVVAN